MSDDKHEDIDDEDELYDEEDGEIDDIDVADDNDNVTVKPTPSSQAGQCVS
jgi:hypothetical protein